MRNANLLFVAAVFSLAAALAMAQNSICPDPKGKLPSCSYTATNGKCLVTINRMNPVTPPTIYVTRGGSVTVCVVDPSPLEDLTLDWKSSAIVIPPDTFQSAFSSLTANLGKLTNVVTFRKIQAYSLDATKPHCETNNTGCDNAPDIADAQKRVLESVDLLAHASGGLNDIQIALQSPPGGKAAYAQPWRDTQNWKVSTAAKLDVQPPPSGVVAAQLNLLASEIADFKKNNTSPQDASDAATLDQNQTALNSARDGLTSTVAKLATLEAAVNELPDSGADIKGNAVIEDLTGDKRTYETQSWTVNYTNKLLVTAKRVAADKLKSKNEALLSGLADPPLKQPLVTVTAQFQSPSRIEVFSGLMVPLTPYHSYTKASVAKNGIVNDNVVQENKTYTVVPTAFINVLAKEWIVHQQRSALFLTGGVGYNPATNAVEFGAGLTYSYRSLAISGLADIGRDTRLGGGFTVGQSLGATNAAASPITSLFWTVKPTVAISVRIPLGGSGSGKQ